MNKGLSHIFENLTKSEKRYIQLSFDPIKHKKVVNAYRQMEQQGFVDVSITAVIQTRLLDYILTYLNGFHKKRDPKRSIIDDIDKAKMLSFKGDHDLSDKYLSKAKKAAELQENWSLLLSILEIQIISLKREGLRMAESRAFLKDLHSQEIAVQSKLKHLSDIRFHTIDYLLISRNKIGALSENVTQEFEPLIAKLGKISFENECTEYHIFLSNLKGMFCFNTSNYEDSLNHFKATSQLIENSYMGQELFSKEYFFALNNQLVNSVFTQKYDTYIALLTKIKAYFSHLPEFKNELFTTTLMYEIGLNTEIGEFHKVVDAESTILEGFKKIKVNTVNRHIFYFNLSYALFATGNTNKAMRYIIDLITDIPTKRVKSNSNIYFYANLLSLIIRLEKQEYDFLPYAVKSTLKQMSDIRELNVFDALIVKYVKACTSNPERDKELSAELSRNSVFIKSEQAKFAKHFFDFDAWIKSRINGKTMHIIKQEQQKTIL